MAQGKDLDDRLNDGTVDLDAIEPMMTPPGKQSPTPAFKRFADVAPGALARFERRARGDEKPIPLPFPVLAEALGGGLWPGFHVFVAGTGKGKTQLALQTALFAAQQGIPALYVGLELGALDWVARLLGAQSRTAWSKLFLGQASPAELELHRLHAESLARLPLYLIEGPPQGWPYTQISTEAQALRTLHPKENGPALLVIDFLQIVGKSTEREEIRERVGSAAYRCREIARDLDFAVLALSSTARDNYGTLETSYGLEIEEGPRRGVVRNPDSLIGLGKESGEVEYSADSVLVAMKLPPPAESLILGEPEEQRRYRKGVAIVAAKVRAGRPGWAPFDFNGHNFTEHPLPDMKAWLESLGTLKEAQEKKPKKKREHGSKLPANGNARAPIEG